MFHLLCRTRVKKIHFHANFRMILMITGFHIVFPLLLIPQCWYFLFQLEIENCNYFHPFNFVLNINGLFFGRSKNSGWRVGRVKSYGIIGYSNAATLYTQIFIIYLADSVCVIWLWWKIGAFFNNSLIALAT